VHAEITENTLRAVPSILDQDGYHDTSPGPSTDDPAALGHLISTPETARWRTDVAGGNPPKVPGWPEGAPGTVICRGTSIYL
jgi:hypothetical protein